MGKQTPAVPRKPSKSRLATERLKRLRGKARIGDVMSPSGERWNAERGRR